MRKNRLLIVLFTGVAVLLSLASCTYDYFEDETNYQVFVPEVLNKTVSDCRVLVYNDAGTLVGARYATSPWDKDPRMEAGLFSFRLTPGEYKVYCYTNTDSLTFVDGQHLDASAFILKSSSTGPNRYVAFGYIIPEVRTRNCTSGHFTDRYRSTGTLYRTYNGSV